MSNNRIESFFELTVLCEYRGFKQDVNKMNGTSGILYVQSLFITYNNKYK